MLKMVGFTSKTIRNFHLPPAFRSTLKSMTVLKGFKGLNWIKNSKGSFTSVMFWFTLVTEKNFLTRTSNSSGKLTKSKKIIIKLRFFWDFTGNIDFMSETVVLALELDDSLEIDFNGFFKGFGSALGFEMIRYLIRNTFGYSSYRVSPFDFIVHWYHYHTLVTIYFSRYKRKWYLYNIHSRNLK